MSEFDPRDYEGVTLEKEHAEERREYVRKCECHHPNCRSYYDEDTWKCTGCGQFFCLAHLNGIYLCDACFDPQQPNANVHPVMRGIVNDLLGIAERIERATVKEVMSQHQLTTFADGSATITVTCSRCNESQTLHIKTRDYSRWMAGELVQRAFPYLKPNQREVLISRVCGKCFDKMFEREAADVHV